MPFLDELSDRTKPLFQAVNHGYTPTEYVGLTEGMTGFFAHGQDAFALNPPIAGLTRDLTREQGIAVTQHPAGDRFILRTILGYATAARCVNDMAVCNLVISNLINSMMGAAYKVYGPRIQRLTFDRPGDPNGQEYLRELEHTACYEIRLYGELTPMETVNG